MDYPTLTYLNRSLHGGTNGRLNGRLLSDIEAEELLNADISQPGLRKKRLDPTTVDDLLEPTVPATPEGLDDNTDTTIAVCSTTVSWSAVTGAVSYEVKLYAGGSCAGTALVTASVSAEYTSYTFTGLTGGTTYSWTVQAIGDGEDYADSNVTACQSFTTDEITLDDDLPDGVVGSAYSADVAASGGTSPYTYAVTSGALPSALSLASNGTLSGTPDTAETATFTITATDANGCTGSRAYEVVIQPVVPAACPGVPPLAATYTINVVGGLGPESVVVTYVNDCLYQGVGVIYVETFQIQLAPGQYWQADKGGDVWRQPYGTTPIGAGYVKDTGATFSSVTVTA